MYLEIFTGPDVASWLSCCQHCPASPEFLSGFVGGDTSQLQGCCSELQDGAALGAVLPFTSLKSLPWVIPEVAHGRNHLVISFCFSLGWRSGCGVLCKGLQPKAQPGPHHPRFTVQEFPVFSRALFPHKTKSLVKRWLSGGSQICDMTDAHSSHSSCSPQMLTAWHTCVTNGERALIQNLLVHGVGRSCSNCAHSCWAPGAGWFQATPAAKPASDGQAVVEVLVGHRQRVLFTTPGKFPAASKFPSMWACCPCGVHGCTEV